MDKILFINACVRPCSRTLELAKTLLQRLKGEILEVRLQEMPMVALDLNGLEKRDQAAQKNDFSDPVFTAAKQFAAADIIVIAAPYWDLMFPATLKTYLENITISGITFRYSEQGRPESLCKAKVLHYVTTAGGFIGQNDFGFSYVKALAQNFFGISEIHRYAAEGLDIFGTDVETILGKTKQEISKASGELGISWPGGEKMANIKKLTILHSNDLHGDFLAEEVDAQLIGGVSMLSGYVGKVRREEKNAIYCIAGDMFRGSVIDSEFRGISTIEIMNMLAPDVVTVGNHEIDYGISHLLFLEKCAKFPIINANMYIKTNHARLFQPHHVIEIDGIKILFIGILTESALSMAKKEALVGGFIDIADATAEVERICNAYNAMDIDCTVLLTHIGFEEDKQLAAQLDPALGVDIIIGGHSHTLLEKPEVVNSILITQAGTGTDQIGRFDLEIDTDSNRIQNFTWKSIPITAEHCPRDTALEEILGRYKSVAEEKYARVVTRLKRQLTHPSWYQETELGGFLADILQESLRLDMMLVGSGSIRVTELGPIVLFSNLTECIPYDDAAIALWVKGAQLKKMILYMLRDEVWDGSHCEFFQFSEGMRVVYDKSNHKLKEFSLHGAPIEEEKVYKIGLQYYFYLNLKDFFSISYEEVAQNGNPRQIATSCREVLDEYLSCHRNLDRQISGRLRIE